jgi:hypothetical protein
VTNEEEKNTEISREQLLSCSSTTREAVIVRLRDFNGRTLRQGLVKRGHGRQAGIKILAKHGSRFAEVG